MDVKEEWKFWEDKAMIIEESMDHPTEEVDVDMDEKKQCHKAPDVVENIGEDKTLVDMD